MSGVAALSSVKVPFIDLSRETREIAEAFRSDVAGLVEKTAFIGGPALEEFETKFKKRFGIAHFVGCANGTDALTLALRTAGVGPGDAVLVSTFSFVATVETVCTLGAKPVFVDVNPETLQTGLAEIKKALGQGEGEAEKKIKAAQLAFIYGWAPSDLAEIRAFFVEKGVPLIEDWAQGTGTRLNGREVLGGCKLGTVSFYPAKVLGAMGDAGGVICASEEDARKVRKFANHGRDGHYTYSEWGYNSRMDGFQAAALSRKLGIFDRVLAHRQQAARWYRENLSSKHIRIPSPPPGVEENGYLFPVLTAHRDSLEKFLKERGIGTSIVYPLPLHSQPVAERTLSGLPRLQGAEKLSREALCLPLFYGISKDELGSVASAIREFQP